MRRGDGTRIDVPEAAAGMIRRGLADVLDDLDDWRDGDGALRMPASRSRAVVDRLARLRDVAAELEKGAR